MIGSIVYPTFPFPFKQKGEIYSKIQGRAKELDYQSIEKLSKASQIIQRCWKSFRAKNPMTLFERFKVGISTPTTHKKLLQDYQPIEFIAQGGHGDVVGAMDKKTKLPVAIKIDPRAPNSNDVLISTKVNEALVETPHLTRIYELLKSPILYVPRKPYDETTLPQHSRLSFKTFKENFFHPVIYSSRIKNPRLSFNMITVMEKLESDLQALGPSKEDNEIFGFQVDYTYQLLERKYGVEVRDRSWKNVVYKELTPEDLFNGKRLIDYKYWKYQINGVDSYIPRPKLLIKLCDYDCGMIPVESTSSACQTSSVPSKDFPKPSDCLEDEILAINE
ncbi:MAG: hypothetical protein V4489_03195 [Chlamydiota bacterium]